MLDVVYKVCQCVGVDVVVDCDQRDHRPRRDLDMHLPDLDIQPVLARYSTELKRRHGSIQYRVAAMAAHSAELQRFSGGKLDSCGSATECPTDTPCHAPHKDPCTEEILPSAVFRNRQGSCIQLKP